MIGNIYIVHCQIYQSIVKKQGIVVSNHSSIEGDDWIWYWSRRLNEEGTSCIIWSSDNDLKQLVQGR